MPSVRERVVVCRPTIRVRMCASTAVQQTAAIVIMAETRAGFFHLRLKGNVFMSEQREEQERPCLHCMMIELIDDFFAEYPATASSDKVDTGEADEVIDAIAKTVAELTSQQDGVIRQQVIEELTRQIMDCDAEFRGEDAVGAIASRARH
jgi:hypothetical protein